MLHVLPSLSYGYKIYLLGRNWRGGSRFVYFWEEIHHPAILLFHVFYGMDHCLGYVIRLHQSTVEHLLILSIITEVIVLAYKICSSRITCFFFSNTGINSYGIENSRRTFQGIMFYICRYIHIWGTVSRLPCSGHPKPEGVAPGPPMVPGPQL